MRKSGSCLQKEIMQGTMLGAMQARKPCMVWMDNIKTCTGLHVKESIRMTEDREISTASMWPTLRSSMAKQNRLSPEGGSVVWWLRRWTHDFHCGFNSQRWHCLVTLEIGKSLQQVNYLGMLPPPRSTQPCIPPGSLNWVPALAGVKVGK